MSTHKQVLSPSRHVVSAFVFTTLLPLVYYIPPWINRNITNDRLFVTVLALLIIVPIISYIALPFLFKSFEILDKYNGET